MRGDYAGPESLELANLRAKVADLERELLHLRSGETELTYFTKFPPASLAHRVGGADQSGKVYPDFLISGFQVLHNLIAVLSRHQKSLSDFQDVLDFGCGCGRVIRFLGYERCRGHLVGCDIDPEAIAWCRENIDIADFDVVSFHPPLPYASGRFDLVYSISVFTHLSERDQYQWLDELRRVTAPGAILILTTQSKNETYQRLPAQAKEKLELDGLFFDEANVYFETSRTYGYEFPPDLKLTYHLPRYIRQNWSRYFDVLDIVERAISYSQDAVVLQKRKD